MRRHMTRAVTLLVCGALGSVPARVSAQDTAAAPTTQRAPTTQPSAEQSTGTQPSQMQVTPLKSGWLLAPDVRFTQVNDHDSTLLGGYGGWVTEGALLVGGGGLARQRVGRSEDGVRRVRAGVART